MSLADRLICLALPAVAPLATGGRTLSTSAQLRSANAIFSTTNIFLPYRGRSFRGDCYRQCIENALANIRLKERLHVCAIILDMTCPRREPCLRLRDSKSVSRHHLSIHHRCNDLTNLDCVARALMSEALAGLAFQSTCKHFSCVQSCHPYTRRCKVSFGRTRDTNLKCPA